MRHADVAHQVGQEHDPTAQDTDQQQILALVIAADLLAKLGNARLKLIFRNEHFTQKFPVILHNDLP